MASSHAASFFSSTEMEKMFQEVFGPRLVELNFQHIEKSRWCRERSSGFKDLFYLYPFRPGADYFPYGALSFDYVPRIEGGKLRLRSDAKHASVHLVVTNIGWGNPYGIERERATARQTCVNLAPTIIQNIEDSLKSYNSHEDTLEQFRRKRPSGELRFIIIQKWLCRMFSRWQKPATKKRRSPS
jgi:hypothetical protein